MPIKNIIKFKFNSESKGEHGLLKIYLREKINLDPLLLLLTLFIIYDSHINNYVLYGTSVATTIILFLLLFKIPRIFVHLFMISWLIIVMYQAVFITADLSQDFGSDRDDAVEIATTNLLGGQNPWASKSNLDNPITTGPTSILAAIPSVMLTKKVNSLTFIFWILFFSSLIVLDYRYKNNSFLLLFLLFLIPSLGFQHTIFYSLDELYYTLILFPIVLWFLRKNLLFLAGILFSIIFFNRLSYVFLCVGMYFWWLVRDEWKWKSNLKILSGFILGSIAICLPFFVISGNTILEKNFILNSFLKSIKGNNKIFLLINELGKLLGYHLGILFISSAIIVIILIFSILAKRHQFNNPFWNISFSALLAFSVSFTPVFSADYILSLMIPLFYVIAFSPSLNFSKVVE